MDVYNGSLPFTGAVRREVRRCSRQVKLRELYLANIRRKLLRKPMLIEKQKISVDERVLGALRFRHYVLRSRLSKFFPWVVQTRSFFTIIDQVNVPKFKKKFKNQNKKKPLKRNPVQ